MAARQITNTSILSSDMYLLVVANRYLCQSTALQLLLSKTVYFDHSAYIC